MTMRRVEALAAFCFPLLFSGCQKSGVDSETPTCAALGTEDVDYLGSIPCPSDFERLQGKPLNQIYGGTRSVKFVYSIRDSALYFMDTKEFTSHYAFCNQVLGYPKTSSDFLKEQYYQNPNRLYYLGTINHYEAAGIYALEFIAGDQITGNQIERVYRAVAAQCHCGKELKFYPTSSALAEQARLQDGRVPTIRSEDIFDHQDYQALHCAANFGYLEKVVAGKIGTDYLSRRSIVLTRGVPADIPVVAGVITTDFQTPLSHVNVLSQNRNTPNMALRTGWDDSTLNALVGQLVYFEVQPDTFLISAAELSAAEAFWRQNEPTAGVELECNDSTSGLFDMDSLDHTDYSLVGSKAANFAELGRIDVDTLPPLPLPEGGFAIPFHYYRRHLQSHGLDTVLIGMLSDSGFLSNAEIRKAKLLSFQEAIEKAPVDADFLEEVARKLETRKPYTRFRFRSSTNAEDTEFFNGAGLYASKTGEWGDPDKPVDKAIKQVWASLWTFPAFEERAYYRIDQRRVAMGILVHRSFPDELANGVAITANLYNRKLPGYTINVQKGETSVVSPEPGVTCDQLLFYPFYENAFENPVIEYIAHSSITGGQAVLADAEVLLLSRYLRRIQAWFQTEVHGRKEPTAENFAMDVEFKFDSPDRKLYIKQARPY